MYEELRAVKPGVALVILNLLFGIGLGISFGVNEDSFKTYVSDGVTENPTVHDEKSTSKIWRYVQRAHFHATGISAFSLGLVILIMFSGMKNNLKRIASILIGLGGLYPLSWFAMYWLAPELGRSAAHDHLLTESLAYGGVFGLSAGLIILLGNLFLGLFETEAVD